VSLIWSAISCHLVMGSVEFQSLAQGAAAGEMGTQELHLVGKNISSLQIDVFRMSGCKWDGEQFHARFFRGSSRLVVVATDTGGDHIVPVVGSFLAQWPHVVTGEVPLRKTLATVEADVAVPLEECMVVERRGVVTPHLLQCFAGAQGGNDGVDLDDALSAGFGVDSTVNTVQYPTALVGDLVEEIEPHRIPIVDPLQGHAGNVGAQYLVLKICHFPDSRGRNAS
jgi:hypothetical protein